MRLCRLAAYLWAAPCSLLGLLLALPLLLCGARASRQHGALEIVLWADDKVRRLPFAAITFGHVIIGQNRPLLARLRAHEQVHVRQYQRWGVLFLLAYPAASLWLWLRGRRPYRDNPFEVEARRLGDGERD